MNYLDDKEYLELVSDILKNPEFLKLKSYKHHGINRYEHSINVSYRAYLHAKKKKYKTIKEVARAGLLHDFFHVNNQAIKLGERIKVLFNHPKKSLENAKKYYELNKLEEEIILTHMFPVGFRIPKNKESWLVCLVDDVVSIKERLKKKN